MAIQRPVEHNLYTKMGGTFAFDFSITVNGEPYSLSEQEVQAQVRPFKNSPTLIAEMNTFVNSETGLISLSLTAEETVAINPGTYWYDVALVDRRSEVPTVDYWLEGKFIVNGRVTEVEL